MKSIATLIGWIAIGAITMFAGQQVWTHFQKEQPERSKKIAKKVTETLNKSAETLKETAEAIVEKTDPNPEKPMQSESLETIAPAITENTIEGPVSTEPVDVEETSAEDVKEDAVTDRFYKLAADKPETETPESPRVTESASDYEQRQDKINRKDDILMQRQMRIVEELTGE